jgi:hypothetical protein
MELELLSIRSRSREKYTEEKACLIPEMIYYAANEA